MINFKKIYFFEKAISNDLQWTQFGTALSAMISMLNIKRKIGISINASRFLLMECSLTS